MKSKIVFVLIIAFSSCTYSQSYYTLTGHVSDAENGDNLIGANIVVLGLNLGAATDVNGNFIIKNIPNGVHIIKCDYIGYKFRKDTVQFSGEEKTVNLKIELKIPRGTIIFNPEIEEYQNRLKKLAEKDSLLNIHIDSLKYNDGNVTAFLKFINLSSDTLYVIKACSCFHVIKSSVISLNDSGIVKSNVILLDCDVMPYSLINMSDLIMIKPFTTIEYPPTPIYEYNFNFKWFPVGKYSLRVKYKFGGPASLSGSYASPLDDAILLALRGEFNSDNYAEFEK
jgi:CarboxypepD_reg-like domain